MRAARLAILADIHGNAVALDAVLQDMKRAEITDSVCLGDAVQGGPQPAEVVTRLRDLGCPVVMGNADAWLLSGIETSKEPLTAELREVRTWSLSRLSEPDRAFLAAFSPTVKVELPGGRTLLAFHGSPASFEEMILPQTPPADLARMLEGHDAVFFAGGHTHVQQIRHVGRRTYVNPGSVGFAYRHDQEASAFLADPWAEYAILEAGEDRWSVEFRRVPFDVEVLRHAYRDSGRPGVERALAIYASG